MMTLFVIKSCVEEHPRWGTSEYLHTSKFQFNNWCTEDWLSDDLSQEIVKDIDNSVYLGDYVYKNPIFKVIPYTNISGGAKGLILIHKDITGPRIYDSGIWGDNCAKWIAKLSFERDFTLVINYVHDWYKIDEVCAQTPDGELLNTGMEIMEYIGNVMASYEDDSEILRSDPDDIEYLMDKEFVDSLEDSERAFIAEWWDKPYPPNLGEFRDMVYAVGDERLRAKWG